METLSNVIKEYKYKGGYTVLIGDMNINIVGDNLINNEYLDLLSVSGFASFININTRLPNGRNHACLDHIFINSNEHLINLVNSGVLQTDISDHFSICVSLPIINTLKTKDNTFSIIDHNKIKCLLQTEKWSEIYNKTNTNECFNTFQNIISKAIDISTVNKVISCKNKRLKEWMSAGLLCSTRYKQALSLKCKNNPNNVKLATHYKKYKNKYTSVLRLAKISFYEKKFKSVSHCSKATWHLIN